MTDITAKIDEHGKGAWIALMILGFIVFWPIGLALLAFLIWSGRMGSKKKGRFGRWHYEYRDDSTSGGSRRGSCWSRGRRSGASDNWAFEEYREETLRRLEEEQAEFNDFLDRLRHAEDKAQFERFMNERRSRASDSETVDGEAEDITPENMNRPSGGPAPQPSA